MLLFKLIGIVLMIVGVLVLTYFPSKVYQRSNMTSTGIWFSILVFLIGIIMLVFA